MIRALTLTCCLLSLAACGIDGEPRRPEPRELRTDLPGGTSITVTGQAEFGIAGTL
ncbi:MAG: argininosuccinate lyase [Pseudomonadota bacterium]